MRRPFVVTLLLMSLASIALADGGGKIPPLAAGLSRLSSATPSPR